MRPLRYLSLFSGIEAASVAWKPLGWECVGVSEIEPFPCAVLAHHWPDVPNLGDVTKISEADIAALGRIDLVVFGSPCQDLSVAGKRKGLDGERSGLFFNAVRIVQWAREWGGCRFTLWENVPGAFSSNKGCDFAAVVDALAGLEIGTTDVPPKGWGTEGCTIGPEAMVEWSTLDAQWFGVAQRRRRLFALADFGDWSGRPPILLEPDSLRGDSAPRREAGKESAADVGEGAACCLRQPSNGAAWRGDGADNLVRTAGPGSVLSTSTGEISHCLNADGMGRIDYETETMVVCATGDVTRTLKAEGFDASEDGTGRGTPVIALQDVSGRDKTQNGRGWNEDGVAYTLDTATAQGVAIGCDLFNGAVTGDVAATMGSRGSSQNSSGPTVMHCIAFHHNAQASQLPTVDRDTSVSDALTCSQNAAVAFSCKDYGVDRTRAAPVVTTLAIRGRGDSHDLETRTDGTANALLTPNGGRAGIGVGAIHYGMQVRRLTPRECERLQGFPDDYTLVEVRGKPAADDPRYKALGNSMAVPVMHWIGKEIDFTWRFF